MFPTTGQNYVFHHFILKSSALMSNVFSFRNVSLLSIDIELIINFAEWGREIGSKSHSKLTETE
jgi:hypothetical protein